MNTQAFIKMLSILPYLPKHKRQNQIHRNSHTFGSDTAKRERSGGLDYHTCHLGVSNDW